jgi:hypothetical protein
LNLNLYRNSEKSQRSQLDLCIVLFKTRNPANPDVGRLVEHSKRQVNVIMKTAQKKKVDLFQQPTFYFYYQLTSLTLLMKSTSNLTQLN